MPVVEATAKPLTCPICLDDKPFKMLTHSKCLRASCIECILTIFEQARLARDDWDIDSSNRRIDKCPHCLNIFTDHSGSETSPTKMMADSIKLVAISTLATLLQYLNQAGFAKS